MTKEIEKKKFQVMFREHHNGYKEKAIFINDEKLDYTIDISAYLEACKMGITMKLAVQQDIEKHFTESVSEVLGRRVTLDEIKVAIKTGWI